MKDHRDPLEKSVRENGGGLPTLDLAVFGSGLSRWDAQKADLVGAWVPDDTTPICDLTWDDLTKVQRSFLPRTGSLNPQESKTFSEALNWIGRLSSKAQGLNTAITTAGKVRESEQTVYVMCDRTGRSVQGFLRLGRKHLFLYSDGGGSVYEGDVLCLLDFYVHETLQRRGVGVKLFTAALQREGVAPTDIAYDRPSPKLKPFLRRHFGLSNCLDQPNRFMVFKEYFSGAALRSKQAR